MQRLQERGLLNTEQITQLQSQAGSTSQDFLTVLTKAHVVDEETLAQVCAEVLHVPYVNLQEREIELSALNIVSQDVATTYRVVPFVRSNTEVHIAIADPQNYKAIEVVDFLARNNALHPKIFLASETSIGVGLSQYANLSKEVATVLAHHEAQGETIDDVVPEHEVSDENVNTAPVSKIVSVVLRYAVEGGASDVHIEPSDDESRVRYRVDGVLHTSLRIPKQVHDAVIARIKVLANLKLDETRLPQDGRFRSRIDNREVDFRVSTLPLIGKEKVVLRILDKHQGLYTLEELGFSDRNLDVVHGNLKRPTGMMLLTGPTGSGKTTTLYAIMQILNKEERNIVTLEDPVEYNIPGVSQSQIQPDIGLTFVRGLRSILRQDPDIIMVGEVRDNETAELAVHAALTGHLVLSTLHTNDALGAIPRLIDMKVQHFLIASAMNLVVAQRLIRRSCRACIEPVTIPDQVLHDIIQELQKIPLQSLPADIDMNGTFQLKKGKGCQQCEGLGYKGRIAIVEVVEVTDAFEQLIAAEKYNNNTLIVEELQRQGFISMKQDGIMKALRGFTTLEEVWSATEE